MDDVKPGKETEHTPVQEPMQGESSEPTMFPDEVTGEERTELLKTILNRLNELGVKDKKSRNSKIAEICIAAGARSIEEIKTLDQLEAARQFIDENLPSKEE